MKTLSPKVNLIGSIGALVFAFALSVFAIFGWFLLSSATSGDIESNVISEDCSVIFNVNGQPSTNKLDLIGAMPGIEYKFSAAITNTSGSDGFININIFYPEHPIVGVEGGDMRDAFVVQYGVIGEPPVPNIFPFSDATEINMIKDKELYIDTGALVTLEFSIIMRTGVGEENMNIYQGKEFKINKLEIKVIPAV